ncbi:MAG: lysophospholipase [Actinomycetota bacterium]|nr:lysophospholipase [Actinomycetota bacterium]
MTGSRRWTALLVLLLMAGAACSDGGGGTDEAVEDPVGDARQPSADRVVQFNGASQTRLAGVVNTPAQDGGAAPGVLIVPGLAPTDKDGQVVGTPPDLFYKDLSTSFTAAGLVTFRYDRRGVGQSRLASGQQLSWDDMVGDARSAFAFLGQRSEVGESGLAVVGHDVGGLIALKLAATEPRVKSVVLVSTPGRPLLDVLAEGFAATHGPESAEAFRAAAGTLMSTGSLPPRTTLRAEHQAVLAAGSDGMLRSLLAVDPLADAPAVKVPVLIASGGTSTTVTGADAERLNQALGGRAELVTAANAGPTLLEVSDAPARAADPADHTSHGAPPPQPKTTRDADAMQRISGFLRGSLAAAGQ